MRSTVLLALAAVSAPCSAVDCTKGAVVFCVRGTDPEHHTLKPNPQYDQLPLGMSRTAHAVVKKAGSGQVVPIKYPAIDVSSGVKMAEEKYARSVAMGIHALQEEIENYHSKCKEGKMFVLGYSQGAEVVSGALGGTCITRPVRFDITAALNWADPGFVNKLQPIDAGNATTNDANGAVPNNEPQQNYLNKHLANNYRSFCQAGDAYCNSGHGVSPKEAEDIHVAEPQTYEGKATNFLLSFL